MLFLCCDEICGAMTNHYYGYYNRDDDRDNDGNKDGNNHSNDDPGSGSGGPIFNPIATPQSWLGLADEDQAMMTKMLRLWFHLYLRV